ncbi:MAG: hypothetical protein KDI53_13880 [Candidatus Accumulibacter sp.]|nr:hypothetical protein [Accumulibacter sp.]
MLVPLHPQAIVPTPRDLPSVVSAQFLECELPVLVMIAALRFEAGLDTLRELRQ